jgi:sporulation protein YqfC
MGRKLRRMTLACSLPEDVLLSGARVTMMGRGSVLVEGQCGVVELGSERIRLHTRSGVIAVEGTVLRLRELTGEAAMIEGDRIDSAAYSR